ncbi:VOC family protein [Cohnella soli]|uniref:VOC family protein n=1 Tax=Cohnella soli TaxID=425005 RepID=A0ABW0I1B4_9BACL
MSNEIYLKNFLQVRLVSDFEKAKTYYQDVLGFQVDGWGHTERGNNLGFILQQAHKPEDVRPNPKPYKPTWDEHTIGWDSYFYSNFDGVGQLYNEFKSKGAIIAYEPRIEPMGNRKWKHFAVKDLDGYVMVFGGSD